MSVTPSQADIRTWRWQERIRRNLQRGRPTAFVNARAEAKLERASATIDRIARGLRDEGAE
jgi:hypothetical protein